MGGQENAAGNFPAEFPPSSPAKPVWSLVGRDSHLRQLQSWTDSAVRGGAALCISGSAGTGKTELLNVLATQALQHQAQVLRVTGAEFQVGIGLAALDRLLAPLRPRIHSLNPDHAAALAISLNLADGPPPSEFVLCSAVLALLRKASRDQPLVILCDDGHWLDTASKVVLAFAARRVTGSHIGIAMVVRSGTDDLIETAGLPTLLVPTLEDEAATELLGLRYPELAPQVRQRILAEANGNPLALVEVPSMLSVAQRTGDAALPALLPVSRRLSEIFAPRVMQLPAEARELLLLLALDDSDESGRAISVGDQNAAALQAAEAAGLLSRGWSDERIVFRHPLARSAVVEMASELELRRAHRRLAHISDPGSPRQVLHLAAAAAGTDEAVAAALETLSRDLLRRGDARGSLNAIIRAAELTSDDAARARRYLHAAHIGADITGDLAAAKRLFSAANDERGQDTASALEAAVAAAYLLVNAEADVNAAHRLLIAAIARHPDPTDANDLTLVDALHNLVVLSWWSGSAELWAPVSSAIGQLRPAPPPLLDLCARTFGDPVRLATPARETAQSIIDRLPLEQDPVEITRAAIGCVYLDRAGECREALLRVIADGRAGGAVALAINAAVSTCVDDWLAGRWDEALALAAEGKQLCEQYGYHRYSFILGGYIHALIDAARGDVAGPLEAADELVSWGAARGAGMAVQFAAHIRTLAALAAGNHDAAFAHATTLSPAGTFRPYTPHALWVALDVVEAALGSGRLDAASAHVQAMRAADLPSISSRLALITHGCAAMVAAATDAEDEASSDTAEALFERALAVPGGRHWPFELARIRLSCGEHHRRRRQQHEARTQLELALTLFNGLGARSWRDRTAAALRSVGGTVEPVRAPSVTGVTAHQWRIAQLAAAGLTNRQIGERLGVSHRTIGAALYQLFPKLGITTRAELRDALTALDESASAEDAPGR